MRFKEILVARILAGEEEPEGRNRKDKEARRLRKEIMEHIEQTFQQRT